MAITNHPLLHFIEIGTSLDFAQRHGWDKDPDWHGTEDEWMFSIDGYTGRVICQSADHAKEAAEEELFLRDPDLYESKIRNLRMAEDLEQLMSLVELKGYWRGKQAAQANTKSLLAPVMETLGRLA